MGINLYFLVIQTLQAPRRAFYENPWIYNYEGTVMSKSRVEFGNLKTISKTIVSNFQIVKNYAIIIYLDVQLSFFYVCYYLYQKMLCNLGSNPITSLPN